MENDLFFRTLKKINHLRYSEQFYWYYSVASIIAWNPVMSQSEPLTWKYFFLSMLTSKIDIHLANKVNSGLQKSALTYVLGRDHERNVNIVIFRWFLSHLHYFSLFQPTEDSSCTHSGHDERGWQPPLKFKYRLLFRNCIPVDDLCRNNNL